MIQTAQKKLTSEKFLTQRSNQAAVGVEILSSREVSDSRRRTGLLNKAIYAGMIIFDISVGLFIVLLVSSLSQTSLPPIVFYVVAITDVVMLVAANRIFWNSTIARPLEARKLPSLLPWGGDEKVLEVGFGSGFYSLEAAKQVTRSAVAGVEIWGLSEKKSNSEERQLRPVTRRSEVTGTNTNDSALLPLKNDAYDILLSTLQFPRSRSSVDRRQALAEMSRVLKPGGWIGLLTLGNCGEITKALEGNNFKDIEAHAARTYFLASASLVVARKKSNFKAIAL